MGINNIQEFLRVSRYEKGHTQEQAAQILGISRQLLYLIEAGKQKNFRPKTFRSLVKYCDLIYDDDGELSNATEPAANIEDNRNECIDG